VYRFAGGAPLYVSSWANVGGAKPTTLVDQKALENGDGDAPYNHVHTYPANGTFVSVLSGAAYRIAGAAALHISSWTVYGGVQSSTLIDKTAIDNAAGAMPWNHLLKLPIDGTLLEGLPSQTFWQLRGGNRLSVSGPQPAAVGVPDDALAQFPILSVPGPPSGVSAVAGDASATVSWAPPASTGNSPITGYTITASPGGLVLAVAAVARSAVVSGLTNGRSYNFTVNATNALGTGPASAASNTVTPHAPRFTLTITKAGRGAGRVISSAGGIDCGRTCAADFVRGTSVTLSARPSANSAFVGWGGACRGTGPCTLMLDAAKTVTATFKQVHAPASLCVVPGVRRKSLATAKRLVIAAHCRVGRVKEAKSKSVPKGHVISQRPRRGSRRHAGSKVNLVVSHGRH
jgi:hypothetical protein